MNKVNFQKVKSMRYRFVVVFGRGDLFEEKKQYFEKNLICHY